MDEIKIDYQELKIAANVLRSLAHPLRMKIIKFIDKNGSINVNKIYKVLKLEQSITSQHLRILRNSRIVVSKKKGKFVFYSLNYKRIADLNKSIKTFLGVS